MTFHTKRAICKVSFSVSSWAILVLSALTSSVILALYWLCCVLLWVVWNSQVGSLKSEKLNSFLCSSIKFLSRGKKHWNYIETSSTLMYKLLACIFCELDNRFVRPEPETIKICIDCNRTIKDFNSTVTVVDGPVTVYTNFYSFRL